MKTLLLFLLLTPSFVSISQNHYKGIGKDGPALIARKNGRIQAYRMGASVRVVERINTGTRIIKGYITHFNGDQFTIESFGADSSDAKIISAGQVEKIRFLSRRGRRSALILGGAGLLYTGIIAILTPAGPYQYILFLPAMACGLFLVYYFPATYLADILFEKSARRGWKFAVEVNYLNR